MCYSANRRRERSAFHARLSRAPVVRWAACQGSIKRPTWASTASPPRVARSRRCTGGATQGHGAGGMKGPRGRGPPARLVGGPSQERCLLRLLVAVGYSLDLRLPLFVGHAQQTLGEFLLTFLPAFPPALHSPPLLEYLCQHLKCVHSKCASSRALPAALRLREPDLFLQLCVLDRPLSYPHQKGCARLPMVVN